MPIGSHLLISWFKPNILNEMKYETIFLRWLSLSRFLAKTLRINKIALKSWSKIYRLETILNCRSCHSYIKLTHTHIQHKWCEKLGRNPSWRFVISTYIYMYLCMWRKNRTKFNPWTGFILALMTPRFVLYAPTPVTSENFIRKAVNGWPFHISSM